MKRTIWLTAAAVLFGLAGPAGAADHRDGPGVDADPTTDITDLYAWMSADASKVYLALDVQAANTGATLTTKWPNAALYVFHFTSTSAYGQPVTNPLTIICQFDTAANQGFKCWGPEGEYVTDVINNTAGKTSASGKMRVAAIVREDPFPFNIRGFIATANAVKGAAAGLMFDAAGCPKVDSATSTVRVNTLKSDGAGGTPTTPADSAVNQFGDPRAYFYPSFNTLSPNGGAFVGLDGDPGANGQISQTVTGLTIGDTYILKFNWGAAQLANRVGATTEMLKVSFGVDTVSTPLVANPSKGFSGWINQTFKFKALSKSQTLSFLSIGTPRGLPPVAVLDGVSLTGGGVPEPASWAMMILGMGGLGVVLRRNRVARGARA